MVGSNYACYVGASQRAGSRLYQQLPYSAGLVVYEDIFSNLGGQQLVANRGV